MSLLKPSVTFNVLANALEQVKEQVCAQKPAWSEYEAQKIGFIAVLENYNYYLEFAAQHGARITPEELRQVYDTARIIGKEDPRTTVGKFIRESGPALIDVPQDPFIIRTLARITTQIFTRQDVIEEWVKVAREAKPDIEIGAFKQGIEKAIKYFEDLNMKKIQDESYLNDIPDFQPKN